MSADGPTLTDSRATVAVHGRSLIQRTGDS
jgi:hypothetical protein